MRSPELEKILADHSLWLRSDGAEGIRLDLSGAALSRANLSEADLDGALLPWKTDQA
jgi:uncharacterized protein YjbI with pentapeptide repeats